MDKGIELKAQYQEWTYEFKESANACMWRVVWKLEEPTERTVWIFSKSFGANMYEFRQSFQTTKVPTMWDSIDFIRLSDFYKAKHSKP